MMVGRVDRGSVRAHQGSLPWLFVCLLQARSYADVCEQSRQRVSILMKGGDSKLQKQADVCIVFMLAFDTERCPPIT